MPPAAAARRAQPPAPADQGRRSSGRQVRSSISRPTNYYARPFGSMSSLPVEDSQDDSPPGFFPAVQYFTDAAASLPKEVMRHFTLMKEVEAKIHGPTQEMARIVDRIAQLPSAPRKSFQPSRQALLAFTANNSSVGGSTNVSMINGNIPGLAQTSVPDITEQTAQVSPADEQVEFRRRQEFNNLRLTIMQVLQNLDEKNGCLAEANRALDKELGRMDSVMPHVESEISEEARLGSLTHWAYADNRKKHGGAQAPDRSRRDVAATSNLAAAAAAIHEGEIAAARNEGRRETKKSRLQMQVDSEMDLPAKKSHHKGRKALETDKNAGTAIGPSSQPSAKKRKVEKVGGAAMERSASTAGKAGKGAASTPRSTPAMELSKKKSKPPVLPTSKKRMPGASSPAQSPRLAASPLVANFTSATEIPGARPASRMRQQSASTLQNSVLASRVSPPKEPKEAQKKPNGDARTNGDETHVPVKSTADEAQDVPMPDIDIPGVTSSKDESAMDRYEQDNVANKNDTSAIMSDGDLTPGHGRSVDGRSRDRSAHMRRSAAARDGESKHSRSGSHNHILKQIASFNRSPVMGRRSLPGTEDDSSDEESRHRSQSRTKRPGRSIKRQESRARSSDVEEELPAPPPLEPEIEVEEQEDGEDHDPDDPDEPKYCYCGRGSYGTMIGCENENCEREWFHLECTGLRAVPSENVKWYCDDCDPRSRKKSRGRH